jgi:hypothetical protein
MSVSLAFGAECVAAGHKDQAAGRARIAAIYDRHGHGSLSRVPDVNARIRKAESARVIATDAMTAEVTYPSDSRPRVDGAADTLDSRSLGSSVRVARGALWPVLKYIYIN